MAATDILKGGAAWYGGGTAALFFGINPFIGASLGLGGYLWKKSQVHPYADIFVNNPDEGQNVFGQNVAKIIDPITQARAAGTLTYAQAKTASQQLEDEIAHFFSSANAYAIQGTKQNKVVENAIGPQGNLTPIIASWRDSLAQDLTRLKPKIRAPQIPTVGSILSRTNQTVAGQGALAQAQLVKRLAAGGPRQYMLGTPMAPGVSQIRAVGY